MMLHLIARHTGRIGPAPPPHVLHWYRRVNLVANYSRKSPRVIALVSAWSGLSCDNSHTITPPAFSAASRAFFSIVARSEEHTSELQSLMRISYAVFCLKKKNK